MDGPRPMKKIKNLIHFLTRDLWNFRLSDLDPKRSFWFRVIRIIILSFREFDRDGCILRASALTFYTLLSIVPIFAMLFGVAKGFGLEQKLETAIREKTKGLEIAVKEEDLGKSEIETGEMDSDKQEDSQAPQTEDDTTSVSLTAENKPGAETLKMGGESINVVDQIIKFANNLLQNVSGGVVAGIGVMILFWTLIKVLGNIEKSFNAIWGVKKSRSLGRKFSDYVAFTILCPFLLLIASSMTVLITSKVEGFVERLELWGWLGSLVFAAMRILPLSLLWGMFTFTYLFMPNTKVRLSSGIIGGIAAGVLFQLVQIIYLRSQIGVTRYSAIYGSFAALPFFLVWLQASWFIVLYGGELAFAYQNVDTYEFEPGCQNVRPAFRRLVALAVAHYCVKRFEELKPPPTADDISKQMETPVRLVNAVLYDLVKAHILSETHRDESDETAYQPGRETCDLTIDKVMHLLDTTGSEDIPIASSAAIDQISKALDEFRKLREESSHNALLKDL